MGIEVVQKDFQGGLPRIFWTCGLLAVCVLAFCFWRGDVAREGRATQAASASCEIPVSAQPPILSGALDGSAYRESGNRSIRESDYYLVAGRNLAEGTVLTSADLKVVKMPGLHGYELAFFSPRAVTGMSIAHAVPAGQPVLPYHVEASLKHRKYHKSSTPAQE